MATSYKIQRKTATGVEDIEIDASTLSGKDSSYYLNYNNLTNKPDDINVKQSSTTTGKWRKLLLGSQASETTASAVTETTDQAYANSNLEYQASTGTLKTSTLSLTNTTATHHIKFDRGGWNYISAPNSGGTIAIVAGKSNSDGTAAGALASLVVQSNNLIPGLRDNQVDLGGTYGGANYHFKDFYLKGSIKNGSNVYTLPASSGTLALKSDLPTNATTSKAGLMSSTDKTNLNTLSALLGEDSDTTVNKINEVIEIFDSYPEGDKIADALAGKQSKVAKLGSTSKPVYVSADGTFSEASTYAGGTKVTLNGTDKGASTATIYAPTAVGTSGQILKSNGSGAPTWVAQSTLSAGSATKATQDGSGNVITSTYATKDETATARNIAAALNSAHVVNADGTLEAKYDGDGNEITATYAKKEYAVYYVEGNTTGTAGTWTGTNNDITSLYDGLVINYKIGIAGADTTKLNINGLGAKTCYLRGTTKITSSHYAVGTMVLLAYNATTGAFYSADYDANSYAYVRQYKTTTNANYPMLFAYETALPSSNYSTKYTRMNSNITANPSTGTINATSFIEDGTALGSKYLPLSGGTITGNLAIGDYNVITEATQSVIDLGTISSTPASSTCADLDNIKTPGIYTFKAPGYSADYPTTYIMTVSLGYAGNATAPVYQHILGCNSTSTPHTYIRYCNTSGVWSYTSYAPSNCAASGNTSSKLFLIGRTSQSSTGGVTYSHDTVYVNTDGHLYDNGNRVLTTADNVGGGTVSGNYLPLTGGTIDGNLTLTGYFATQNNISMQPCYGLEAQAPHGYSYIGFNDEGYVCFVNPDRQIAISSDTLDGDLCFYTFSEDGGYVPATETQGTSGQVLTSNGDGTYKWSTVSGGGTSSGSGGVLAFKNDGSIALAGIDLGYIFDEYIIEFLLYNGRHDRYFRVKANRHEIYAQNSLYLDHLQVHSGGILGWFINVVIEPDGSCIIMDENYIGDWAADYEGISSVEEIYLTPINLT